MPGRKLKLTNDLIKQFESIIKAGCNYREACGHLGVPERSFYRWLSEGEKADSGLKRQFWQRIKASEAESEIRNVIVIQKAAQTNWKAAAWFLERRFPRRWGKKPQPSMIDMESEPDDVKIVRQRLLEKFNALDLSKK